MKSIRLTALMLTLALSLSLVPMAGGLAEADEIIVEDIDAQEGVDVDELPGEADIRFDVVPDGEDDAEPEGDAGAPEDVAQPEAVEDAPEDDVTVQAEAAASNALGEEAVSANAVQPNATAQLPISNGISPNLVTEGGAKHTVTITQKGSVVTVKGTISAPHYFYGLYVDTRLVAPVTGSSVNQTINMNNFATGYHTVWLATVEGNGTQITGGIFESFISSNNITAKPTYKGSFEVYDTQLYFYPYKLAAFPPNTGYGTNQYLYLELSPDNGKNWLHYRMDRYNLVTTVSAQKTRVTNLKPKTTYKARLRYGELVKYSRENGGDDRSYYFAGPVLATTTIKTGAATAPSIKSVKAKAVSVKYHKHKVAGHYEWAGTSLIWIGSYTEKYYTCKIKVTVKLKKKPGTKGLFISCAGQTKWVSGNKKTYTATFTPYPNYYTKKPKGHYSYTVTVRSGQNKSWGGYSPIWSKSKKLS